MPSDRDTATIRLAAKTPATELSVVDADYRLVAQGVGRLEVPVRPGMYRIQYRCGPASDSKLISLLDDDIYADDAVALALPSAAPVRGTSTTSIEHEERVADASAGLAAAGATSGLVLVARDLGIDDAAPLPPEKLGIKILDGVGRDVAEPQWTRHDGGAALVWAAPHKPGGYVLEARHPTAPDLSTRQVLRLSPGWQTLVFAPMRGGRPAMTEASIQMAPAADGWDPGDEINVRAEAALWDLRADGTFTAESVAACGGTVACNPMLAMLQLHGFDGHDLDDVLEVVSELELALPDHPDVQILRWRLAELRATHSSDALVVPPADPIDWPPMLGVAYRALRRLDARRPGAIRAGTLAEAAASVLVLDGTWTSWDAQPDRAPIGRRGGQLDLTGGDWHAETRRVQAHVERVAAVREGVSVQDALGLDPDEIALATGLSSATVARALTDLQVAATTQETAEAAQATAAEPEPPGAEARALPTRPAIAPLTPWERRLRDIARLLALVTIVLTTCWLWAVATGTTDAVMAVGLTTELLLVGFLLVVVAGNVRRFAGLAAALAGMTFFSGVLGLWGAWLAGGDPVAFLWWDLDERIVLLVNGGCSLAFSAVLGWASAKAQRDRFGLKALSAGTRRTLSAIGDAYAPASPGVTGDDVARHADRYLARLTARRRRSGLKLALHVVAFLPVLGLRGTLSLISTDERRALLSEAASVGGWAHVPRRHVTRVGHQLAALGYYADDRVVKEILGDRPAPAEGTPSAPPSAGGRPALQVERPADVKGPTMTADVVVVGSGICGALVAYRLAERGRSVLIVEQGTHVEAPRADLEALHDLYRDGGAHLMRDFERRYVRATGVGGSSLLSDPEWTMVPEPVIRRWNEAPYRAGLDADAFAQALERVKCLVPGINRPAGQLSDGACRLKAGLGELGVPVSGQRPAGDEEQEGPHPTSGPAELSSRSNAVVDTLLPWGRKRFGDRLRLLSECRAHKLSRSGDGVQVDCRLRNGKRLRVDAAAVVVAAGPVDSSALLRRSDIGGRGVGRSLSFAVSASVIADFPEALDADLGVQLSAYAGERPDGFVVSTDWEPLPLQAMLMPGWFDEHVHNMRRYRHMTSASALISADGAGRVRGDRAVFSPPDTMFDDLAERLHLVARAYLAAGAERVLLPIPEQREVRADPSLDELRRLARDGNLALNLRPQGGNAISEDPELGAVDPTFRVHGEERIFVCDPSVFPTAITVAPGLTSLTLAEYATPVIAAALDGS